MELPDEILQVLAREVKKESEILAEKYRKELDKRISKIISTIVLDISKYYNDIHPKTP